MKKIYEVYNRIEKNLLGLIMCVLIIMGFTQVLCRFVFKMSLAWAEEMMTFCMIWLAYLGSSAAAHEKKHILVSMFVDLFPKPLRKVLTVLSQMLWLICSAIMLYLGGYVTVNYINRKAATLGGKYPFWFASVIIPVSMFLIGIRIILLIIQSFRGDSDTRSQEEIVREEIDI